MLYSELLTDIIIAILILVSITFIANVKVKDNKKNPTREDDEITDDDLTDLAKCNYIRWSMLSYNPNAVKLLKKRFDYEKSLSDAEYKKLPLDYKIDWVRISKNNGALELIKERVEYEKLLGDKYEYQTSATSSQRNKINWEYMLEIDNATELLREKIKYQKSLNSDEYAILQDKILLYNLSPNNKNKNIMILMKDYYLSNK
jgi:hypothetical protein